MKTMEVMSRCHEFDGIWVPEIGSKAYQEDRTAMMDAMHGRPGANDREDTADSAVSRDRKRFDKMTPAQKAREHKRLTGKIKHVHHMHGRCSQVNTIEKLRNPELIVVGDHEFRMIEMDDPDILCSRCLRTFVERKRSA